VTTKVLTSTTTVYGASSKHNQRAVAKAPDGKTWVLAYDGGSTLALYYTSDHGTTSALATSGATIAIGGTANYPKANRSLFIDADGYAHVLYVDRQTGFLWYRRGTPSGGTGWTWSAATAVHTTNVDANAGGQIVAHKEGTGYCAHVVYALQNNTNSQCVYRRIDVTSGGAITVGSATNLNGTAHPANEDTTPDIDFRHDGGGMVVAGGTSPHLFVTWQGGQANATHGWKYRMATYSGGSWTWGTERSLASRYISSLHRWLNVLWDGTRVVLASQLSDGTVVQWEQQERDTADTSLAVRTFSTDISSDGNEGTGQFTYDGAGNVHYVLRAPSSDSLRYRVWRRGTAALDGSWTTLDASIPTANYPLPSLKRGTSDGWLELAYVDKTASPYDVAYMSIVTNSAPNAPTLVGPVGGTVVNRAITQRFSWTVSDPDLGDSQSKYDLQYRTVGSSTWTTVTQQTPSQFRDFTGSTFAAADYEWQVRTYDAQGTQGPWSASGFFTAADPPAGATIITPTNGSVIGQSTATLTWSVPNQDAFEVRKVADLAGAPDTATVYWASPTVVNPVTRNYDVPFQTNNRYEHVQVRIRYSGIWTDWATVRVQVSYTPPAKPIVTAVGVDALGVGVQHAVQITVADGGGATTANVCLISVRDQATWEKWDIAYGQALGTFIWYAPAANAVYDVAVLVGAPNNTFTWADPLSVGPIALNGVLLHDPADNDSLIGLRYNEDGAKDTWSVETAFTQYQGRKAPVVEFGDAEVRTIEVPMIHLKDQSLAQALRSLIARRTILCYRDSKGRKEFGVISESQLQDVVYGHTTSIQFTVTDYDGLG
jgi:hypothetical protein